MTDAVYQQVKSSAGKLKLKALALLAMGGDDERFEAAVLLQEAPLLRGLRGVISDLVAGRRPSVETLYRVGLGGLVTRAPANERNDPLRLLVGGRDHGADLPHAAAG